MLGITKYFGLRGNSLNLAISWIAGLDFFLFGYDQGVTGGLLDLPSFTKHFPEINPDAEGINAIESEARSTYQGITVAAYNLGCFLGSLFTIFVGNSLGRRKTIFFGSIIMTVGALLQCTSYTLPQFLIGRIVTGWGNGMSTSTVPTWQSETASAHARGKLVMIEGMLITAGITTSYWINYGMTWIGEKEVAWRFPVAFQIVFASIIWGTVLNLPESPRWLVMKGRDDDALEVLEALNGKSREDIFIKSEFESVKLTVLEMSRGSYKSLFQMTEYREFHRVALAYIIQVFQQISGINLITYYAPILFSQINLSGNNLPKLLAACNGTEYFLASLIPIFIIECVGRRKLMLLATTGMSLSMVCLTVTLWALNAGHAGGGPAHVVFLFVFNTFFAIGWLGIPWLYPAEIVPLRIRAPTNALSTSANWIFNFLVVMITPVAFKTIGYKFYIVFAVINAAILPVVYFFYPETRYRSLEEMDDIFKKSSSVFNVVSISLRQPHRYDEHGQLKEEYLEAIEYHENAQGIKSIKDSEYLP
ncbi:hypothetical protein N7481_010457 [Penicillium waksmanii]|uniref:uncharacterized protein n=1 Tax=Penicillium waksmanii TaxID=69791 RepID=UPI00254926B4|nr:uncharacterized protein N7481_010457 [Penicillium waksmanii]KAJ5973247.1 hypothetical protein N7481_010457 [Penicillium waksmanii]